MTSESILTPSVSGDDNKAHSLMCGFSTQTRQVSYRNTSAAAPFQKHELNKKREYGERIREVENSSFTPQVFSTGGARREIIHEFLTNKKLIIITQKVRHCFIKSSIEFQVQFFTNHSLAKKVIVI